MKDFYSQSRADLERFVAAAGLPAYRARQLQAWQDRGATEFSQMSDLPLALRELLAAHFRPFPLQLLTVERSATDQTTKALFQLTDGEAIETVAMRYETHWSCCVSSQVGCRMGCTFCASTGAGFARNLSVAEMLAQVLAMGPLVGQAMSRVTVMGIGEPLENLPNLIAFCRRLNDPKGLNISLRHLAVSTCGLVDKMLELADEAMPIQVSVSLHAPNQAIRERLMPIARRYDYESLLDACRVLIQKTRRRITFEYALFDGVNDRERDARELAAVLGGMLAHVNLIPANPVPGSDHRKSPPHRVRRFQALLADRGMAVTVRRELGSDITAACGQLRRKRDQ